MILWLIENYLTPSSSRFYYFTRRIFLLPKEIFIYFGYSPSTLKSLLQQSCLRIRSFQVMDNESLGHGESGSPVS